MAPVARIPLIVLLPVIAACQGAPSGLATDSDPDRDPAPPYDPGVGDVGPTWPADEPLPFELDFPPFITMPAPNHFVIGFRTSSAHTARVHIGVTDSYGTIVLTATDDGQFHVADLGVLEPATAYHYEVEIDGTSARRKGVFLTSGSDRWRFMHLAEFHAASESDNVELFANRIRAFQPHVIIESGDMLDNGDNLNGWRSYFRTSAPWISNAIILPIGSNHVNGTGGNGFLQYFFSLPNNERWYSTRYSQARIFSLDSTYGVARPEIEALEPAWLAAELAEPPLDGPDDPSFVIGAWHYPACSTLQAGRFRSREWVMENFIDTFIAHGQPDLVLTGHDKFYERSLIDGSIPHITTNAGKLAPGAEGDNHTRCTPLVTDAQTRSILLGTVNATTMHLTAIDTDGVMLDSFSIEAGQVATD